MERETNDGLTLTYFSIPKANNFISEDNFKKILKSHFGYSMSPYQV